MDDKIVLFLILIPGILIGVSYYFMKDAKSGKRHFTILCTLLILVNLLYQIGLNKTSPSEFNFSNGIKWLFFFYIELIFLLFFSIIYGFVSLKRKK